MKTVLSAHTPVLPLASWSKTRAIKGMDNWLLCNITFSLHFLVALGKCTFLVCPPWAVATHTAPQGPDEEKGCAQALTHLFFLHSVCQVYTVIKYLSSVYCGTSPQLGPINAELRGTWFLPTSDSQSSGE